MPLRGRDARIVHLKMQKVFEGFQFFQAQAASITRVCGRVSGSTHVCALRMVKNAQ
jgi:hypothetical protein